MAVDELARLTGTTSRNVRALQTKGLLPGPTLVGRTGEYGKEHVLRLRAVLGLQARGFGLRAIRELVVAWETGMTLDEVLGLPPRGRARRRAARPHDTSGFEDLLESLTPWRGPHDGLLPGPLLSAN